MFLIYEAELQLHDGVKESEALATDPLHTTDVFIEDVSGSSL